MWSRKFDKCVNCGTTERKHVAKGLCIKCYTLNTEAEHKKHNRSKRGVAEEFLTKEKLVELYVDKGLSLTDIGKIAGCTRVNVHYKLKRYGITARTKAEARTKALDKGKITVLKTGEDGEEKEVVYQKIRYNENFFKKWSAGMAYVLGLIYTDGNIHIREARSGYIQGVLSFAQKERELVVKFLKLMDCNAKVIYKKRVELKNTTAGELYYFSIGNNQLVKDLMKLGVTPNKSLDMKFPNIPADYLSHFVRGLFDGDGSVYLEPLHYIRVKFISGSKKFLEVLNSQLVNHGLQDRPIYGGTKSAPNAYHIRYNSSKEIMKFYKFIYRDCTENIYYSRKKVIFEKYFNM